MLTGAISGTGEVNPPGTPGLIWFLFSEVRIVRAFVLVMYFPLCLSCLFLDNPFTQLFPQIYILYVRPSVKFMKNADIKA